MNHRILHKINGFKTSKTEVNVQITNIKHHFSIDAFKTNQLGSEYLHF